MRIINLFAMSTLSASLLLSGQSFANGHHTMPMPTTQNQQSADIPVNHSPHQTESVLPKTATEKKPQPLQQEQSSSDQADHAAHIKEHGGQVYQHTTVESKWLRNDDGEGVLKSQLETRIGTDENKIFIKVHADQAESKQTEYEAKVLYSRMLNDFWDVQTGLHYLNNQNREVDSEQLGAVLGIHGLAPYFFETDVYLYLGKDKQGSLSLETERDLLLTQKLILKPYLDVNIVLSDDSNYAKKSGLSRAQLGLETRYEINKKVMPFVDIAYGYTKGNQQTAWQQQSDSGNEWLYGAGIRFKF